MLQQSIKPRDSWQERLCELGFDFYEVSDSHPYWDESQFFQVTMDQVNEIDRVSEELHLLFIDAVKYVFDNDLLHLFGVPERHHELLKQSFLNDPSYLYGRFDFAWDGANPAKVLEYNSQTPTSLFEASVAAWDWMKQNVDKGLLPSDSDQFNLLDEQLITQFSYLKVTKKPVTPVLHFVCDEGSSEDRRTVTYLAACAEDAGWETVIIDVSDIHLTVDNQFADHNKKVIQNLFSLYPYEFALFDEYADYIKDSGCKFIEPLWKVILSSKALLPILWKLNPNHPNLLACYFAGDENSKKLKRRVTKPIYSREGANISIEFEGEVIEGSDGFYGDEGYIHQEYAPLAKFNNGYCVIGSWLIGKVGCGISFRESNKLITNDVSRFVPHIILN